jgi:starch-binding outer membrane protein, SusD/RagB family
LFTSCSKMLEEKPEDRLFTAGFYKTNSDAVAAVNAIYANFRSSSLFAFSWPTVYQAMEDYTTGKGQFVFFGQYKALPSTAFAITDGAWLSWYTTINTANIVLKYVPAISMDATQKNALLGEARFLRAFSYFELVKGWGAVPIKKGPTEDPNATGGKREAVADVYAFIIDDLKFAEANLPSTVSAAGRPSKWAAKTMLADVYLIREDWTNARIKADEVIQSGAYSLVNVKQASDFDQIFSPDNPTSSEDVFAIKSTRISGLGMQIPAFYHNSDAAWAARGFATFSTNNTYPLIAQWSNNDLRKTYDLYTQYPNKSGVIKTNPPTDPIRFGKFKDAKATDNRSHGISYPIYRYPDALLIYAEAASQENNGPTALALERLNMVHRRAYGFTPTVASADDYNLAGQTAASFRNLVLTERAYEFLCENGKRWRDLVRTGTAAQVIKTAKEIDIAQAAYLFPIPQQEIDNNPDIDQKDQNPGY